LAEFEKIERLQSRFGNCEIFVGHGFKPCRKVRGISSALEAAEKVIHIVILIEVKNLSWV
jgi:hypothetical protein